MDKQTEEILNKELDELTEEQIEEVYKVFNEIHRPKKLGRHEQIKERCIAYAIKYRRILSPKEVAEEYKDDTNPNRYKYAIKKAIREGLLIENNFEGYVMGITPNYDNQRVKIQCDKILNEITEDLLNKESKYLMGKLLSKSNAKKTLITISENKEQIEKARAEGTLEHIFKILAANDKLRNELSDHLELLKMPKKFCNFIRNINSDSLKKLNK